jgi:UDP-N-acetylglucosamine 2-epimerase
MMSLKVMTILGTRPEIIRLSRVMARLDIFTNHVVVHTGQNWDYELNDVFYDEMQIRRPDYFLGVGGGTLGETLGAILEKSEVVLRKEKPDALLVLGDTNSAISTIMARRLRIPVYHMEAGNRSYDRNVPEETNRTLVDHISDFNLVYTEHARRQLLAEGVKHRRIYLTGSPMREVLDYYRHEINASGILKKLDLTERQYFLVSLHREENVDDSGRLRVLLESVDELSRIHNKPAIFSTHPRTRKRLEGGALFDGGRIRFLNPFGFFDYNHLQTKAFCVVSDSGTIAEESSILSFPAITPRDAIERPEALDVGCIMMTGVNRNAIIDGVAFVTRRFSEYERSQLPIPSDYCVGNTSDRVVALILGTARVSNQWDGVRSF